MILLEPEEADIALMRNCKDGYGAVVKATGKKILIELQAIYNIPDLRQSDKRMGEFIQSLQEEVKQSYEKEVGIV